jgi:hypothetical protein
MSILSLVLVILSHWGLRYPSEMNTLLNYFRILAGDLLNYNITALYLHTWMCGLSSCS